MTNSKTVLESVIPAVSKSNGDYYGKDGLLYCGKCHTPKEAFFAKNFVLMGKNRQDGARATGSHYSSAKAQRTCPTVESRGLLGYGNARLEL